MELVRTLVRIYGPWITVQFSDLAPIVLVHLVWPWSIDCIMKFTEMISADFEYVYLINRETSIP